MAFLAPLFLAGLAALALPVLLHLRKNRPKETVAFSSLMFFEDHPPITKRRSRLQDILLLVLRCVALALLVLAFARPFFPAKIEDLNGVYSQIADELASQYTIGYTSKNPRNDGAFRRIVVQVARPNVSARTKKGYFAPTR